MDLLAEIRAAFPATPYPGDDTLSDCWCDECEWSVRNLRGKSWKQVRIEDGIGSEGASLSVRACRYYLPAMLCLAVQHPDDHRLASAINARLVVIGPAEPEEINTVGDTVRRLSPRQRGALVRFLIWVGGQGWQSPMLIEAALRAVRDGRVVPVDSEELRLWTKARFALLREQSA